MRPPFLLFAVHVHSKTKITMLVLSSPFRLCMYMFCACSIITAGVAKLMNNDS